MEIFSIEYALLAMQRSLLGIVTPELRGVLVDICKEERFVYIRLYYDGESSEKHIDLWECSITETSAALGPELVLDDGVKRLDYPLPLPLRGRYAYLRKEPIPFLQIVDQAPLTVNQEQYPLAYALLSLQRALLGIITSQLRAVTIDIPEEEKLIFIRFFYEEGVSSEATDLWERAISQITADMGTAYSADALIEKLPYPRKIPLRGIYAYLRGE